MNRLSIVLTFLALHFLIPLTGYCQKEVNDLSQFWGSLNSTTRVTERFGFVADFHMRRNDLFKDPSFYFVRFGSHFWLSENFALTIGYAHLWQAPEKDSQTWTGENRIYQQIQYSTTIGKVGVLNRIRNEQRWKDELQNDTLTGETLFSDRIRYLASFFIPVSKSPSFPLLVLSDEILFQFGKEVVYNTFDQNRFFVGIKKGLSRSWSFDLGYMPVLVQKSTGYQYDLNHTLRIFFYFTPDLSSAKSTFEPAGNEE